MDNSRNDINVNDQLYKGPSRRILKNQIICSRQKQVAKYGNRPLTAGEKLDCSLLMTHIKAFKNHLLISAFDTKGEIFVENERKILILRRFTSSFISILVFSTIHLLFSFHLQG